MVSAEVRAKIDYVERFAELKKAGLARVGSVAGVITAAPSDPSDGFTIRASNAPTGFSIGPSGSGVVGRAEDDDDVDGAPISAGLMAGYNRYAADHDSDDDQRSRRSHGVGGYDDKKSSYYDDDDVDGVPIGLASATTTTTAATGTSRLSGGKAGYDVDGDNDDVDGLPLGAPMAYQSSARPAVNTTYDDDDVDGIPLNPALLSAVASSQPSSSAAGGTMKKRKRTDSDSSDEEDDDRGPGRIQFF
jgi:hypothetical protein